MSFHPQCTSSSMDWELGNRKKTSHPQQARKQGTGPMLPSLIESSVCSDSRQVHFRPPLGCEAWLCCSLDFPLGANCFSERDCAKQLNSPFLPQSSFSDARGWARAPAFPVGCKLLRVNKYICSLFKL